MKLKIRGYRLNHLNTNALLHVLKFARAEPAVKLTAKRLITGGDFDDTNWKPDTISGYRVRARKLLRSLLLEDPTEFGLVKIQPEAIDTKMNPTELAEYCDIPIVHVYNLIKDCEAHGLARPDWPLGRTLTGRGWIFTAELAQEYAKILLEE